MEVRPSNKSIWFELGAFLAMLALLLLCLPAPRSTAQAPQSNRQLKRDRAQPNGASGRRLALVIGNGAYTNAPPLKNPPNDARDMAATLKVLGFEVVSGINVNQRDMKRLIRDFGQTLKAGGSGLFYYAGHGVQSKGHNYLVPVDADIQSEAEVEDSGVDVNLVLNYMDDAQNGLNIVILDACRNNPFSRSFRSASNGLAQVDAPTGTLIAYATAPGRVASDGMGQNGLYTSELLKQMQVPGLSVIEMFMHVRSEVMKQTGSKQVPWEASSLIGMFYFSAPAKNSASLPTSAAANETKFDPAAIELSYWDSIKSSNNPEDFKAYLQQYPNGRFAALARIRAYPKPSVTEPSPSVTSKPLPQKVVVRDFIFELSSCNFSAGILACQFTITNDASEDKLLRLSCTSRVFDDLGNDYRASECQLGSEKSRIDFIGAAASSWLVPHIVTKAALKFKNINQEATRITLLRIAFISDFSEFSADFRNPSLTK